MPEVHQYVHSISPFAIKFTETFGIRWYGLAYLAAFVVGYIFIDYMAKKGRILLSREQVSDFVTFAAIGTLVGGRLGYAIFYSPELFTQVSSTFPYWGVLEVQKGGMASHGGILGVFAACWYFGRLNKIPALHLLDLTTFSGALGFFFGRIANFINGELYGREAPSTLSWAVKFPQEIYHWGTKELDKLKLLAPAVEAVGPQGNQPAVDQATWVDWVQRYDFAGRSGIEHFKEALVNATQNGNQKVIELMAPVLTPRYPSQLIQCLVEGFLVFLILLWVWRKPQKPGVMAGVFGSCYCVARIIGEQFRLPDYGIGYQWLGLTRGQWLSVAMVIAAVGLLIFSLRRPTEKIGGWK